MFIDEIRNIIYCRKRSKQVPLFPFVFSQLLVFYICDVVRSMNKDEDVRYMDRVHRKLQEKNINCWVTIAGRENKLLGNNADLSVKLSTMLSFFCFCFFLSWSLFCFVSFLLFKTVSNTRL